MSILKLILCVSLFDSSLPLYAASHSVPIATTVQSAPANSFTQMDTFALEWASEPRISPDGKTVAYVRNGFDVLTDRRTQAIWTIDIASGVHLPLSNSGVNQFSPRWAPDGKRIAYIATTRPISTLSSNSATHAPSNRSAQLYVHWLAYNRTARLTRLTESPQSLTWSADGDWLAFSMLVPEHTTPLVETSQATKPEGAEWAPAPKVIERLLYRSDGAGYIKDGYRQLFLIAAEGGAARQITQGPFHHGGRLSFSLDSNSIYLSANRHDDWEYDPINSELYRVSLADGEFTQLTTRHGPDQAPAISPDGRYLAYTGFDDNLLGYQIAQLYLLDLNNPNKPPQSLTSHLDRSVVNPRWDESAKSIYFQFDSEGESQLAKVDLSGKISPLVKHVGGTSLSRPYTGGSYTSTTAATGGRKKVAFTQTSTQSPAEIAVSDGRGGSTTLTALNAAWLPHRQLAQVEPLTIQSKVDGRSIAAWVAKPHHYDPARRYPLILEIHGGPFAAYGPHFSVEVQLYAAAGYMVLYMNPRGSSSYGAEFGNLIHHAYPGKDFADLMSGVDEIIRRGWADPDQLYVTGGSGGGVLTAWAVGHTDRFRAAVAAKPVINWYSFVLTADSYNFFYKYWFDKPPWESPDSYLARSPLSFVGNVTTPTMLITGEQDYRTPISESEQFYQALKLRKVSSALVRIPGASHGIANRPSQLNSKVAHILAWFNRYSGVSASSDGVSE